MTIAMSKMKLSCTTNQNLVGQDEENDDAAISGLSTTA